MGKTAILSVRIVSDAKKAVDGLKDAENGVGGLAGRLGKISPGALAVGGAVVSGIAAAGKALYDLGGEFDEVADTIRVGTGATGDALQGLIDDAHAVATSVPTSFEQAGTTVADLNTRLGLSGDTLQTVASQYLEAGRILGEDVDISTTTAAFSAFGIEGERVEGAMDSLFQVSQATGVSMNDLAGSAQKNAGAMSELGFTFDDTIGLIGGLDKAGVDADSTLNAMRKGMLNLAQPGEDMRDAFDRVTGQIGDYIKAGDDAAALDLAGEVFGTRGAAQMVQALKTGKLSVDDLKAATGATSDTILQVGEDTQDAAEKWQILKNKGKEALEPLASGLFDLAGKGLGALTDAIEGVDWGPITGGISDYFSEAQKNLDWLNGLDLTPVTNALNNFKDKLAPLGDRLGEVWEKLKKFGETMRQALAPVIETLAPLIGEVLTTAFSIVSDVLSGIGDVLEDVLTVFTGFFHIIQGIFTGDWSTIWTGVKEVFSGAWNGIKDIFSTVWNVIKDTMGGAAAQAQAALGALGPTIGRLFSSAWDRAREAVSNGLNRVVSLMRELPSRAANALGNLGHTLWNAGKQLISGFIEGIKHMFSSVKNTLGELTSKLTSWKGPEDLDKRLLTPAGRMIIGGLITGLEDRYGDVRATLTRLTAMIGGTDLGTIDAPWMNLPTTTARAGSATAPVTINVTVNGALDSEATARQIERVLRDHTRRHYGVAA